MKALVLLSGGIDSATCLGIAIKSYGVENVITLSMTYGQKHYKELKAAEDIAEYYGVQHIVIDLKKIFENSNCSLLLHSDKSIPHGSYSKQLESMEAGIVSTYVPFRNGLFLASAASVALSQGCTVVYYGSHADDSAGNAYPDCSEEFNGYMGKAIYEGSGHQLVIEAPFISWTKSQIVKKGIELGVPYNLTWSCYEGKEYPCGVCGTCIDREKAFKLNGMEDPLKKI